MLQLFHIDVAKADRDVAHIASVSEACCNSLLKMFYMFQTYVVSVLSGCCICYNGYVLCCKCMFQMFLLFQLFHLSVAKFDLDAA
jgi:hypothetical protein